MGFFNTKDEVDKIFKEAGFHFEFEREKTSLVRYRKGDWRADYLCKTGTLGSYKRHDGAEFLYNVGLEELPFLLSQMK